MQLSGAGKRPDTNNTAKKVREKQNASPLNKKGLDYLPAGYSGITMLEEKLRLSNVENAALKEEIRSMKMVQEH